MLGSTATTSFMIPSLFHGDAISVYASWFTALAQSVDRAVWSDLLASLKLADINSLPGHIIIESTNALAERKTKHWRMSIVNDGFRDKTLFNHTDDVNAALQRRLILEGMQLPWFTIAMLKFDNRTPAFRHDEKYLTFLLRMLEWYVHWWPEIATIAPRCVHGTATFTAPYQYLSNKDSWWHCWSRILGIFCELDYCESIDKLVSIIENQHGRDITNWLIDKNIVQLVNSRFVLSQLHSIDKIEKARIDKDLSEYARLGAYSEPDRVFDTTAAKCQAGDLRVGGSTQPAHNMEDAENRVIAVMTSNLKGIVEIIRDQLPEVDAFVSRPANGWITIYHADLDEVSTTSPLVRLNPIAIIARVASVICRGLKTVAIAVDCATIHRVHHYWMFNRFGELALQGAFDVIEYDVKALREIISAIEVEAEIRHLDGNRQWRKDHPANCASLHPIAELLGIKECYHNYSELFASIIPFCIKHSFNNSGFLPVSSSLPNEMLNAGRKRGRKRGHS